MALLLNEPGRDVVARLAPGSIMSSVNVAEVISKCLERDIPPKLATGYIRDSAIEVVGFGEELAVAAGELFKVAKKGVLSLGDRACIATAMSLSATAVTADRAWAALDLPCPVELIR